ncbi:hypothetical protein NDN08_004291 [Rhodosorus marinus]|uniref:C2H2-type domain-containing protein n=1 Tax=Rhodosorus marinus TaxID=101924 RepID=A0AAV8UNY7_9RHOD|nr:hypothetical protein NDN08_004291 [Rhodosorus marinus]
MDMSNDSSYVEERKYACDAKRCGKKFTRKYDRKVHMRVHNDERPYRCKIQSCDKSFRWRSGLRNHMRWHAPAEETSRRRSLSSVVSFLSDDVLVEYPSVPVNELLEEAETLCADVILETQFQQESEFRLSDDSCPISGFLSDPGYWAMEDMSIVS